MEGFERLCTTEQIKRFQEFFRIYHKVELESLINEMSQINAITVDFMSLNEYDLDLASELLQNPEDSLKAAQIAITSITDKEKVEIRFRNLPKDTVIPIWQLRAEHTGKFITLKTIVVQASDVYQKCVSIRQECPSCGNVLNILQPALADTLKEVQKCGCGRRGRFTTLSKEMVDRQRIVLEEDIKGTDEDGKIQQPKRKIAYVESGLTDRELNKNIQVGRKVNVYGYLVERPLNMARPTNEFTTDFMVNNMEFSSDDWDSVKLTPQDIEKIKEMAKSPTIIEDLAHSINPNIEGHEAPKEALLYSVVGGNHVYSSNGKLESRGLVHTILCGSPGAGKSSMMRKAVSLCPGSRISTGKGATGAGLIAVVIYDKALGQWVVYGGVVPTCSGSLVGIDEMDKMNATDYGYMNNAMEDMRVPIDKATIHAIFNAETGIIATANPIHRIFERGAGAPPLHKQIALPKDLLDRFDYIFVVDNPQGETEQRKVIKKIIGNYRQSDSVKPIYHKELVLKYVSYARKVEPVLLEEIDEYVEDQAIKLLRPKNDIDEKYISTRIIPTILRTTVAVAKTHLSNEVTLKHAERSIKLLIESYKSQGAFNEETGQITFEKVEAVTPKKDRNKYTGLKDLIQEMEKTRSDGIIEVQDLCMKAKDKFFIKDSQFEDMLEKLLRSGEIFEPKRGYIKRI